jgi:hypothetical protein
MSDLELFVAVLTGIAVFFPTLIDWFEKKDRLKKTVYLIELLKTRDELTGIIEKQQEGSPILLDKLQNSLSEIEREINSEKQSFSYGWFISFVSIEIFFVFGGLSEIIISNASSTGLLFLEGALYHPIMRILLLLLLIGGSIFVTFKLSSPIKAWFNGKLSYNLTLIVFFNFVFTTLLMLTYAFLKITDPISPFY